MHEIHAVKNIISLINQKAKENNLTKISKVNIVLGKLSGITKDDFSYWFNELSKNTIAHVVKLEFKESLDPNVFIESIEA